VKSDKSRLYAQVNQFLFPSEILASFENVCSWDVLGQPAARPLPVQVGQGRGEGCTWPSRGRVVSAAKAAPPYGKRKGWIPRTVEDFGDGGAFPEIHVAQYPLKNIIQLYIRVSVVLS
jgi:hypothetical protein